MKDYLYLLGSGKLVLSILAPREFAVQKLVNQERQTGTLFFEINKKEAGITEITSSRWECIQPDFGFHTTKTKAFERFFIVGRHGRIVNFTKTIFNFSSKQLFLDKITLEKTKVRLFLNVIDVEKNGYLSKLNNVSFGQVMVSKERGCVLKRMFFAELDLYKNNSAKIPDDKNIIFQEKIKKFEESIMLKRQIWSNTSDMPLRFVKHFCLTTRDEETIIFSPADDKDQSFCNWKDVSVF